MSDASSSVKSTDSAMWLLKIRAERLGAALLGETDLTKYDRAEAYIIGYEDCLSGSFDPRKVMDA